MLMDLLSGGLLIGAFFMATDYTTSPIHTKARVVFAIGRGILTMVIRQFGSLAGGRLLLHSYNEYPCASH